MLAAFYEGTGRADRAEPYFKVLGAVDRSGTFLLADYYARAGRIDEAVSILYPLSAVDEDGSANARLAALMYDRGDRSGAAARVDAVLRAHRDHPIALLVKSRMAIDDGRWAEARDAAQAASAGRASGLASDLLGVAETGLREFKAASDAFGEAIRLNPRVAGLYVKRAEALAAASDGWSAIQSLERAYPDQPAVVAALANNIAWQLATVAGDRRGALTLAQYAADRLKKRPEPLDTLGLIYLRSGDHARAEELFRASLRMAPDNETYRSHLTAARSANAGSTDRSAAPTLAVEGPVRPPR